MATIAYYCGKPFSILMGIVVGVVVFIAYSPALVGILLLGWQVLVWVFTGHWDSMSLADGLHVIGLDAVPALAAQGEVSTAGNLMEVAHRIPLSLSLVVAGLLLSGTIAYGYDALRERMRTRAQGESRPPLDAPLAAALPRRAAPQVSAHSQGPSPPDSQIEKQAA